jgi:hypothetical protein
MFELAGLFMILGVVAAVVVALVVFGLLAKIVFKLALLPLFVAVGLLKLLLIPVLFLVGLLVAVIVGPVLLVIGAIFLVPILIVGGLVWAGAHVLA